MPEEIPPFLAGMLEEFLKDREFRKMLHDRIHIAEHEDAVRKEGERLDKEREK